MWLSTIQLWDLQYELMFPREYSGTGLSEHRVNHWIWNMNEEKTCLFLHSALPKFMNFPSLFCFEFCKGVRESVGSQQNISINEFISTQIGSLSCWLPVFCDSHELSPPARSVHLLASLKIGRGEEEVTKK